MREPFASGYIENLKKRRAHSKPISKGYQVAGLMLAEILSDRAHKRLYLKLAREYDNDALLMLAKDVAERRGIANYGAYFMRRFQQTKNSVRRINMPRRKQTQLPLRKKQIKKS
ncbi:MAG: hypothetical protein HYU81_00370 [Candidatus Brennerbacteria bacterium]|nr:hypothetical protein [Candidatus Brennerbacteria bacterium]